MKSFLIVFIASICLSAGSPLGKKDDHDDGEFILGGNDTDISAVPYQVSIFGNDNFFCGGAILNSKYILTAAHCVSELKPLRTVIRAGSTKLNSGGVEVEVDDFYVSPDFSWMKQDFDMAVLSLSKALNFSSTIQPVELPTMEPKPGAMGRVSGWGVTLENETSEILQSVYVPVVDRETCQKALSLTIRESMICAGGVENKDSCYGDSGSPLTVDGKLVGLVSTGDDCGHKGVPGVYTNVAHPKILAFLKYFTD